MKARSSDSGTMSGVTRWESCQGVTNGSDLSNYPSLIDGHRYVQYRFDLSTDDIAKPAEMDSVTLGYEYYPEKQELISNIYNTTVSTNRIMDISWTEIQPSNTDVRFQLRTATTEEGIAAAPWLGPAGTQSFTNDYSDINDYSIASEIELADGAAKLKKIYQDFDYTQRIVIDNTSGVAMAEAVLKLELTSDNIDFWDHVKSDGSDVRFADDLGQSLAYNLHANGASFDFPNKTATIFVEIPAIDAASKKTIYMKYGNATAESASTDKVSYTSALASSQFDAYDASATDGLTPKAFHYGVTDGRFIYFTPHSIGHYSKASVALRYDTQGDLNTATSWDAHDFNPTDGLECAGYIGGCFDGKYVYFAPYNNYTCASEPGDGSVNAPYYNYSGKVLRYNSQAAFTDSGSWSAFEAGNIRNLCTKGFHNAIYADGYVYFVPNYCHSYSGGPGNHANFMRYNTSLDFKDAASYESHDGKLTDGFGSVGGFSGAASDGRYIYFDDSGDTGVMVRYDTQGGFDDSSSWSAYNASSTGGYNCKGYKGVVFDGRSVYYTPYKNNDDMGWNTHGTVLRYDTEGDFKDEDSWSSYNAGYTSGLRTHGYAGAVFNGRYVYFDHHGIFNILLHAAPWQSVETSGRQ